MFIHLHIPDRPNRRMCKCINLARSEDPLGWLQPGLPEFPENLHVPGLEIFD